MQAAADAGEVVTATRQPVIATTTAVAAARRVLATLLTESPYECVTVHRTAVREVGYMRAACGCTAKRFPVATGDESPGGGYRFVPVRVVRDAAGRPWVTWTGCSRSGVPVALIVSDRPR